MRKAFKSFILASLTLVATARVAFAYIDPSTGGMLLQTLATAFALISGLALLFSRQIRVVFARARRSLRRVFGREDQHVQDLQAHSQRAEGREER